MQRNFGVVFTVITFGKSMPQVERLTHSDLTPYGHCAISIQHQLNRAQCEMALRRRTRAFMTPGQGGRFTSLP
jgi:hypothetical protein